MKLFVWFLVIALITLQYQLWIAGNGVRATLQLSHAIDAQKQENISLQTQNDVLAAEIEDLKNGLSAVEERARSELGMIREGETFVQIIDRSRHPPR